MSGLLQARARLVERGLLTPDFRLTDAGNAFVDATIADLKMTLPPPADSSKSTGRRWVWP